MTAKATPRVFELDLLRLVAAVMVLLYHHTWRGAALPHLRAPEFPGLVNGITRYGFLGVELFFFISGMVIFRSAAHGSARRFFISRIARLYPAYWVMVTISYVVVRIAGNPAGLGVSPRAYAFNLTMLQTFHGTDLVDGVYWTLAIELSFYAIVWLTLLLRQGKNLFPVLSAWLLGSIVVDLLHDHHAVSGAIYSPAQTYLAVQWAPFFVAGACCALLGTDRRHDWRVWVVLGTSGASAVWRSAQYTNHNVGVLFPPGSYELWISAVVVAAL
ncbi:MAG TPA: acyltransferase, partial [Acidimicrobiales bacterium]